MTKEVVLHCLMYCPFSVMLKAGICHTVGMYNILNQPLTNWLDPLSTHPCLLTDLGFLFFLPLIYKSVYCFSRVFKSYQSYCPIKILYYLVYLTSLSQIWTSTSCSPCVYPPVNPQILPSPTELSNLLLAAWFC